MAAPPGPVEGRERLDDVAPEVEEGIHPRGLHAASASFERPATATRRLPCLEQGGQRRHRLHVGGVGAQTTAPGAPLAVKPRPRPRAWGSRRSRRPRSRRGEEGHREADARLVIGEGTEVGEEEAGSGAGGCEGTIRGVAQRLEGLARAPGGQRRSAGGRGAAGQRSRQGAERGAVRAATTAAAVAVPRPSAAATSWAAPVAPGWTWRLGPGAGRGLLRSANSETPVMGSARVASARRRFSAVWATSAGSDPSRSTAGRPPRVSSAWNRARPPRPPAG